MPGDTTIRLRYTTGQPLDTQIESADGRMLVYPDLSFEDLELDHWASYAFITPESPLGSGRYMLDFAALGLPLGNYSWIHLKRAGVDSAPSDVPVGGGGAFWNGSGFGESPPASTAFDGLAAFTTCVDANATPREFVVALMDAALVPEESLWLGLFACATNGVNSQSKRTITGYRIVSPTTALITVGSPFCEAPAQGDSFCIL